MTHSDRRHLTSSFRLPTSDIAIAVSGGADSMALLHMTVQQKQPQQKIVALTVDHGLRAESAAEAQAVANYCVSLDIEHHVLRWDGDKPQTGLQTRARTARRTMLLEKSRDLGITDLLLAHQADDQAETFLQRLARGSGPQGLSGMRAKIVQQGITLHRPLLGMRRSALRAYCHTHGVPFHDDPSNEDTRYERICWRRIAAEIETTRPDFVTGVVRSQQRLHEAAEAIDRIAQSWLAAHQKSECDVIMLPRPELALQPRAVTVAILRRLMPSAKQHQASLERLEDWVAQAFDPLTDPMESALTLNGWWLQLKKDRLVVQAAPLRRQI